MKNFVTHEPNTISGVLRIGASQSFAQSHMPAILKGFVDEYNDIEISLTTDTSDRLTKLVKKEDVDFINRVKIQQRNWIGRSEGTEVDFTEEIGRAHV